MFTGQWTLVIHDYPTLKPCKVSVKPPETGVTYFFLKLPEKRGAFVVRYLMGCSTNRSALICSVSYTHSSGAKLERPEKREETTEIYVLISIRIAFTESDNFYDKTRVFLCGEYIRKNSDPYNFTWIRNGYFFYLHVYG